MSATETKTPIAATSETIAELLRTQPSPGQTKEKPFYTVALACLLLVWAVFSLATATFVVALVLPGHLGLSDLLQALGNLLPADLPSLYGTLMMIDRLG
jgi:hypothetical protein